MLTFEERTRGNILRFKARGELTQADHAEFLARLDALIQKCGKVRIFCVLEDVQKSKCCEAWLDPTALFRRKDCVRRFALVGKEMDSAPLSRMSEAFTDTRFFPLEAGEEAWKWVTEHTDEDIDQEHIRRLAYAKWEAGGRPEDNGVKFWNEAQRELCNAV